jgi:phosphoribosylanthranilate isomerase
LAGVKICGVTNIEDAMLAEDAGAMYVGMVISEGFLRSVSVDLIRDVASILSRSKLVVVAADRDALKKAVGSGLDVIIQLHLEDLSVEDIEEASRRGYRVIPTVISRGSPNIYIDQKISLIRGFSKYVEYTLIDIPKDRLQRQAIAGSKDLPVELYRYGCSRYRPCGVAGGITPENVISLKHVAPNVIDVSSGVESSPGKKDPMKVRKLVEVARDL